MIGIVEIIVGFSFILGTRFVCFRKIAFIGSTIIFCVTLSFLFTTPGKWRIIEGVPITDFFILKDIAPVCPVARLLPRVFHDILTRDIRAPDDDIDTQEFGRLDGDEAQVDPALCPIGALP